jgi:uncharacterized Zn-binding protein involved in type VI secretion
MGQPAARVGDMHVCPMVTPGVPPIPHVGGPILPPGGVTVLIGGVPAARMGDMCVCVGPPDVIAKGSTGVFIMGMPAARMGDLTAHGGSIVVGLPTVLIGEVMPGTPPVVVPPIIVLAGGGSSSGINSAANQLRDAIKKAPAHAKAKIAQKENLKRAAAKGTPFCAICEKKKKQLERMEAVIKLKKKAAEKRRQEALTKAQKTNKANIQCAAKEGKGLVSKCKLQ